MFGTAQRNWACFRADDGRESVHVVYTDELEMQSYVAAGTTWRRVGRPILSYQAPAVDDPCWSIDPDGHPAQRLQDAARISENE